MTTEVRFMIGLRSERFDHMRGLFPLKFGESKISPQVVKELKFTQFEVKS